ncbi:MAG: hypothetical protein IKJ65_03955 [Clostridia bacterium]|nr:hypothetical protein [Clostridia bacterium]
MKKIKGETVCYTLSVLLLLLFIIHTIVDYSRYDSTLNSAPFYLWIVVNILYFIIPAMIVFIVGIIIRKKQKAK